MGRTRSILRYFLPGLVLVVLIAASLSYTRSRQLRSSLAFEESHIVREQQLFVARLCESIVADVLTLAHQGEVRRLAGDASPEAVDEVAAELRDFARYKRVYDQVRYIDAAGREVVRINSRNGRTSATPAESLQVKSDRYYVTETLALDPGVIFASPLDLNIEHGEIEQPLLPMIRVGTPVADLDGAKRGMVIVNYRAAELLRPANELARGTAGRLMMLNRDGYWLHGLDPADEFGFMYPDGRDRTMAARFPEAWRHIAAAEQGHFETDEGFFAFATLRPFHTGPAPLVSAREIDGRQAASAPVDAYVWKLVSYVPRAELVADAQGFLRRIALPGALVLLLFGYGAWRQAVAVERRVAAEQALREANAELERRVALRTAALQETSEALNAEIRERITAVLAREDLEVKLANTEGLRALGAVTAGIAHDFNNILMPIMGFAELAQLDAPARGPVAGHLERILKAAGRAQEMIAQILTFSGRRRLDLATIDPAALLREVATQLEPTLPPGVTLRVEAGADVPPITADETRLHRALLNLGRNALQAMAEAGGELVLGVTAAGRGGADARLAITVRDTGPGMAPDVLAHVFEPYFTTKAGRGGTGLGLATTQRVVADHGGTIRADSRVGEGTTFTIELPPTPPVADAARNLPAAS